MAERLQKVGLRVFSPKRTLNAPSMFCASYSESESTSRGLRSPRAAQAEQPEREQCCEGFGGGRVNGRIIARRAAPRRPSGSPAGLCARDAGWLLALEPRVLPNTIGKIDRATRPASASGSGLTSPGSTRTSCADGVGHMIDNSNGDSEVAQRAGRAAMGNSTALGNRPRGIAGVYQDCSCCETTG